MLQFFRILGIIVIASVVTVAQKPFLEYRDIDHQRFSTCGNCGNSGAKGATAKFNQNIVEEPRERRFTRDGRGTEFAIDAEPGTYSNAYWFVKRWGEPRRVPQNIRYEFQLFIPAENEGNMQAIEFAAGMRWTDGFMYRFAWQLNFGTMRWRVFDPTLVEWVDTGIRVRGVRYGEWNTVVVEGAPDMAKRRTRDLAITFNGERHTTATTTAAKKEETEPGQSYLVNAFQLDSNHAGFAYRVYVDEMKLSLY